MQIVRRAGGARLRGSCEAYLEKIHGEVSSWLRGADAGGERGALWGEAGSMLEKACSEFCTSLIPLCLPLLEGKFPH